MKQKGTAIFGSGDLAQIVFRYLSQGLGDVPSFFVVDEEFVGSKKMFGKNIISSRYFLSSNLCSEYSLIFCVGYNDLKQKEQRLKSLIDDGADIQNLNLSQRCFSNSLFNGVGNIVLPDAFVEPGVTIGSGNILWSGTHICHDTTIGSVNFFAARSVVGGFVTIGNQNFFGFGSAIKQNKIITNGITVGINSSVICSLEKQGIYVGSPAIIKE